LRSNFSRITRDFFDVLAQIVVIIKNLKSFNISINLSDPSFSNSLARLTILNLRFSQVSTNESIIISILEKRSLKRNINAALVCGSIFIRQFIFRFETLPLSLGNMSSSHGLFHRGCSNIFLNLS